MENCLAKRDIKIRYKILRFPHFVYADGYALLAFALAADGYDLTSSIYSVLCVSCGCTVFREKRRSSTVNSSAAADQCRGEYIMIVKKKKIALTKPDSISQKLYNDF